MSDYLNGLDDNNGVVTALQTKKDSIATTSSDVKNDGLLEYTNTPPIVTSSDIKEIQNADERMTEQNHVQYLKSKDVSVKTYTFNK